jgi:TM2 domain-containing membrane protein YozV
MKRSTKAVLLSALVCPGAGHIYLKKIIPGIVLIGMSLTASFYLINQSMNQALKAVEQIQNGNIPMDNAAIEALIASQQTSTDILYQNIATFIAVVCWVVGIIDAYRTGTRQERSTNQT